MMNFLAAGALAGAFFAGTRTKVSRRAVSLAALAFGIALGATGAVHSLDLALVGLIAVGATSVAFSASVQSTLQLSVEPEMRGRILSLYQVVYQGSTPLGSIIVGALASTAGARSSLILGSVAAIGASAVALRGGDRARRILRIDRASASGNERVDARDAVVQSNPPPAEPEGASP
jgi:MFS family permease